MPIYTQETIATRNPPAPQKAPGNTIYVPAWYDVIHLVDEKTLTKEEQRRRQLSRITRMKESPSPEIAQNIATIAMALDDIQDFCTTVGVASRIIGRVSKSSAVLARGSFTSGELINSINLSNTVPYELIKPSALKQMIKDKKIDLDRMSLEDLRRLRAVTEVQVPGFKTLTHKEQAAYMRANYKITKERWGQSLKYKKRQAELNYSKGTPWGEIKTQVDKRIARLLPTHGEMLEIAQTSDQLAGIGISLGPLVGFTMDMLFGIGQGAKWKFTSQKPSAGEVDAMMSLVEEFAQNVQDPLGQVRQASDILTKTMYTWATLPEDAVDHFLTSAWAAAQATCVTRGKEVWGAIKNTWNYTSEYLYNPGAHTSVGIKESLIISGIDHSREEGWPGINLSREASVNEICTAYLPLIQKQTRTFEQKLSGTIEGDFLAACLDTIAFNTAAAVSEEGAAIEETFAPELSIYTRAIDYGLEPPIYSLDEEFASWHRYIMDFVQFFDSNGPPYDLLQRAYNKFFPLEDVLED